MVFSSVIFLFLFLPTTLALYFMFPRATRNALLLVLSCAFYFWGEQWLILVMLTSTVVDYICGLVIAREASGGLFKEPVLLPADEPRTRSQKAALAASLVTNLAFLATFKYLITSRSER